MKNKRSDCSECPSKGYPGYTSRNTGRCDILILAEHPGKNDCRLGFYAGKEHRAVLNTCKIVASNHRIGYDFAFGCPPEGGYKAKDIARCAPRLEGVIMDSKPKVVVVLGAKAARAFGIKGPIKKIRGTLIEHRTQDHHFHIVVAYSAGAVYKKPGLAQLLRKDIETAVKVCDGGYREPEYHIHTPQTAEEILHTLQRAKKAAENSSNRLLIAFDTETNTLDPYREDGKIIAVSLSWEINQGTAFLLDHREATYSNWERKKILRALKRLFRSKSVFLCAANAKFDYQWVKYRYRLDMPFPNGDVLLAEHTIAEDKNGEYGLKQQVKSYFPEFGGYDDAMDGALAKARKDQNARQKNLTDKALDNYIEGWQEISDDERKGYLETWAEKGLIPVSAVNEFYRVKTVKKRGKQIPANLYLKKFKALIRPLPTELTGVDLPEIEDPTFEDIPTDILLWYAAMDALVTRKIFAEQHKVLCNTQAYMKKYCTDTSTRLYDALNTISLPLSEKIAEMEYNGVRVDREKIEQHMGIVDQRVAELEESLYSAAGRRFNMSSSAKDLEKILYTDMGLSPVNYTGTGRACTDKESLKILYERNNDPFLTNLVAYREITKVRNTYFRNWLKASAYDGRVHFSLNQHGTATHRLSSTKGLQNAPARLAEINMGVKELLIPDNDNMEFYDLDIANAEMRVLCAYSQDEALIDAFNNDMDFHSLTAAGISDCSYEQILARKEDKASEEYKLRQLGKKINFGTVYSMGPGRLKKQLWSENRIDISEKKAKAYLDKFFETYPGVAGYIRQTKAFATKHKCVYTYTGRIRRFPLIGNDRTQERWAFRQAVNARIQTTSADIVNTNLIDLSNEIQPLGGRVVLTVHDSILFQLPKDTSGVKELLDRVIIDNTREKFPWLPVTWKYDVGRGPNYGECKHDLI